MAFECFARERVEFGVFEVGLGGRLDATNILHPVISIITRIDFDHENFLGHSLREIAAEKAGILKPGIPVVLAEQHPEAREVILARAKDLQCPVIEPASLFHVEEEFLQGGFVRARVTETASGAVFDLAPSLSGRFQLQNALNALAAARFLQSRGFRISGDAMTLGIANTVWPGRLEKLQSHPDIYLDGAHNPSAARELVTFLEQNFAGRRIWLIYAALRDKAVDEVAGILFSRAEEVIFTAPHTSRAISAAQLAEIAGHHAPHFSVIPDAEKALDYALAKAAPEDTVFITGSLYLIGQLRHYWKHRAQVATR
jgi:dihydrofolate synthase/folylpolyglutamate synthase